MLNWIWEIKSLWPSKEKYIQRVSVSRCELLSEKEILRLTTGRQVYRCARIVMPMARIPWFKSLLLTTQVMKMSCTTERAHCLTKMPRFSFILSSCRPDVDSDRILHRETIYSGSTGMHEVQNGPPVSSLFCSQVTKAMQSRSLEEIDPASKSLICADHGHTPGSVQQNDVVGAFQNVHWGQYISFLFHS